MIPLLVQTLKAELSEDCLNHILTRENSFKLMEKWKKFCSIPALPQKILVPKIQTCFKILDLLLLVLF